MKFLLLSFSSLVLFFNARSQGFYSMKHTVDSMYASDNSEDGPKANMERMENRWGGQFGLSGTFTQAAQNFYDFSGSINPNSRINQSGSCGNFIPDWREIGPVMDNSNAVNYANSGAGQMNRITFHPNYDGVNNKTVYGLSRYGGLWVTYDDGTSWQKINTDPFIPFSSLGVLVIDPVNPGRMYLTTGDPNGESAFLGYFATNEYPKYTLGIYATDDGGQNWQKVNSGISTNLLYAPGSIYNLCIDPANHDHLIFTSTDGVYICINASTLLSITWTKDSNFTSIASTYGNDNKIIGLTCNPTSGEWYVSGLNIYTTANPFSTHTWQLATGSSTGLDLSGNIYLNTNEVVARINVVSSPFYTNSIYALLYVGTNNILVAKKTGSGNWQTIKYFNGISRPEDKMALTVSPTNANDVYIGSAYYYFYDSGTDYVYTAYPNILGFHADIHALYIHPSQPDKMWAASDGGISVKDLTVSGFTSGFVYKNKGIQSHLLWDLDDSEVDKDFYISALQDNGIEFRGGILGNDWGSYSGISATTVGDGYDSNIYNADASESYVAGGYNGLQKFNYMTGSLSSAPMSMITGHGSLDYFDDPQYPGERIFIGDWTEMTKSDDHGVSYHNIGADLIYRNVHLNYNSTTVNDACSHQIFRTAYPLNFRSGVPFNVYALSKQVIVTPADTSCHIGPYKSPSLILKSVNGFGKVTPHADQFGDVDGITNALYDAALTTGAIASTSLPFLSGITCHPYNGDKVWVCSSDLLPNLKVWKTTNGGTTWTNADPNGVFNKIPVFDILAAGGPNDLVFAATQDGVYYTDNTMSGNWCRYGASPSVQTFSLKINPCKNVLLVGTYGRGAFEVSLPFMPNLVNIDQATSVTWNTPHHFPQSSLHVKSGTILTIDNTTVDFGPNSRLYVEKGAKVIIQNNAVVGSASACGGYMWLGIELQGDLSQKQILTSGLDANHGMCVMLTGGTVKDALVGVKNFATVNGDGESIDWAKMGGGILQSNGGKFMNCKIGTRFITYSNTNILNLPSNDLSAVYNTQFLTDASIATPHFEPEAHVSMWNTRGVNFTSNTFKNNTPASYDITKRGLGIVSADASYDVLAPCTVYGTNGCSSYGTPNVFENLYYGMSAGASSPASSARVLGNTFTNNHRGLVINGMDHAIAEHNTFNIGESYSQTFLPSTAFIVSAPCGIFLNGSDGYTVQRNTFTNASGTSSLLDFGVVDSYSNTNPNELRMNYFNNIGVGIQAQENNDGLQLKCNEFTASTMSTADVKIAGFQTLGSIDQQQGYCDPDPTKLPGNKFSHTCSSAQDLAASFSVGPQVNYNTRLINSSETPPSGCYNTSYYNINGCTGTGSGDACPVTGPLVGGATLSSGQLQQNLKDSKGTVTALKNLLLKGNRSQLFDVISTGNQAAVIDTINATGGPYLSDSVLIAFLKYKPVYGNGVIRNVLVACSPLSASVLNQFSITGVNGTTRDAVNAAQTSTPSVRTSTELALSYEKKMLVVNYNYLISNLLNDRANDAYLDSVAKYLDYTIKPNSHATMAGILIEKGLYSDALKQVALISDANLNATLTNLVAVRSASNAVEAYTGNVKLAIDSLKLKVPYNIGVKAQALYNGLFNAPYNESIYLSASQQALGARKAAEHKEDEKPVSENSIRVFPNPASNELFFLFDLEESKKITVTLYDINGRLISSKVFDNSREAQKLEIDALSDGIYIYQVVPDTQPAKTGKVVIIK